VYLGGLAHMAETATTETTAEPESEGMAARPRAIAIARSTRSSRKTFRTSNQFSSRDDLRDSIIHEELHHRWWERGEQSPHHSSDYVAEPEKFYTTIERYKRMRGWLPKPGETAAPATTTTETE